MNMKYLLLFLLLASTPAVYSQTDLMDWGNETANSNSKKEVIKQYEFAPQWLDDKFVISGKMDVPGKSSEDIFQLLLTWIADTYPQADKVVLKVDGTGKRILVNTAYISEEYKGSGTFYELNTVFQANDSELVFQQYNFKCKTLGGGLSLSYKVYPFEELFPNLEPKKKKYSGYLDELQNMNNELLSKITHYVISNNNYLTVTHWDAINSKVLVLGMNHTECILSIGKPEKINNTILDGKQLEQWVYSIDKYVYFDNGTLYSMQF